MESSARITAVTSISGGSGKTTTSVMTAQKLAKRGHRTVLIDMNPLGCATWWSLGERPQDNMIGLKEVLSEEASIADALIESPLGFEVLPASFAPFPARWIPSEKEKPYQLRTALEGWLKSESEDPVDFVLLDTPPGLNFLHALALLAADAIVIPVVPDGRAVDSIEDLLKAVDQIKEEAGVAPEIAGVLPSKVDHSRDPYTTEILEQIEESTGSLLFSEETFIPRNDSLRDAPTGHKVPPPSNPAVAAYGKAAGELLSRLKLGS